MRPAAATNWRACWVALRFPAKPAPTRSRCWSARKAPEHAAALRAAGPARCSLVLALREQPALGRHTVKIQFRTRAKLAHEAGTVDVDGLLPHPERRRHLLGRLARGQQ